MAHLAEAHDVADRFHNIMRSLAAGLSSPTLRKRGRLSFLASLGFLCGFWAVLQDSALAQELPRLCCEQFVDPPRRFHVVSKWNWISGLRRILNAPTSSCRMYPAAASAIEGHRFFFRRAFDRYKNPRFLQPGSTRTSVTVTFALSRGCAFSLEHGAHLVKNLFRDSLVTMSGHVHGDFLRNGVRTAQFGDPPGCVQLRL